MFCPQAFQRNQPSAGISSKQPKPSFKPSSSLKQSPKSNPRRSATGTSEMDLLNKQQRYLNRKFDGSIKELKIDDLLNYSVENGKGTCQVKCPICDKPIKVHYGGRRFSSYWILGDVAKHLNRHFK